MPKLPITGRPSSSSRSDPYSTPNPPIGATYGSFNTPPPAPGSSHHFTLFGNRHRFVCDGYRRGDSIRNIEAKTSIRQSTTPVRYIFVAGGHGKMVDSGTIAPGEAQRAQPACTTIFPNYLGEKAVSGASKHTIVANLTALINSKHQQQGRFMQGDFLDILETKDVQKIGGCPAITVYRHSKPLEMMHNLYMFGTGGIHNEDFLNAGTRNPSCFYMINVATGICEDLSAVFKDNIEDWRKKVGAAVADWITKNPLDNSTSAEKMRKINDANAATPNPTFTPKPPDVHYVNKYNGKRVTLADVTSIINTKMSNEPHVSPEECLLYVIACRRCDTGCPKVCRIDSSSGGKTKKRRRRRRTRTARYRSRQVRRRTKRTKRK